SLAQWSGGHGKEGAGLWGGKPGGISRGHDRLSAIRSVLATLTCNGSNGTQERRERMGSLRSTSRTGKRRLALLGVVSLAVCVPLLLAGLAGAGNLTGGFSPTIVA